MATLLGYLRLHLVDVNLELHNPNVYYLELYYCTSVVTVDTPKLKMVALTNLKLHNPNVYYLELQDCTGVITVDTPKLKMVALTNVFRSNEYKKLNLEKLEVLDVPLLNLSPDENDESDDEREEAVKEATKVFLAAAPNADFRLTVPGIPVLHFIIPLEMLELVTP
ncbi:hypothetical protein SELMODRAFT_406127 [Selaginella moellendorffii]|uniref:Uncharacterized protein n=1 Tax=Selaginella moellendorffii TaxID=88036 RepID=D8R1C9_SELML|nr:hypothetical protein SELMODRAFT_406127 [Selaginella moellendorffii]